MSKFFMMVGLPGSGKSTIAHKINNACIISSDDLRKELFNDENYQGNKNILFNELYNRIIESLKLNKNVVYDATNLNSKRRINFLNKIKKIPNIEKNCIFVHEKYKICLERNSNRNRKVPEEVIKNMYKSIDIPVPREGWDNIYVLESKNLDEYNIFNEIDKLSVIPHDNSHHSLSIGAHCIKVAQDVSKNITLNIDRLSKIQIAAFMHDIGKEFCKQFKDINGKDTKEAHYYGHEHVSAYEALFYLDSPNYKNNFSLLDTLYIIDLIQLHMRLFYLKSDKSLEKFKKIIGEEEFEDLSIIHKSDELF